MGSAVELPFSPGRDSLEEERALIAAAQRDPVAFGQLYRRYNARIYSYLRARVWTDEDASDATAQVFLQAFKAMPKYRERGAPFVAWLFRIARNVATDVHRQRRATTPLDAVPENQHPVEPYSPEGVAIKREEAARVRALVAGLPADKREIVLLRFAAGLTLREIAATIGKRESTVHHHLRAAMEMMKEQYNDEA